LLDEARVQLVREFLEIDGSIPASLVLAILRFALSAPARVQFDAEDPTVTRLRYLESKFVRLHSAGTAIPKSLRARCRGGCGLRALLAFSAPTVVLLTPPCRQ
jgi:hypothetical protein